MASEKRYNGAYTPGSYNSYFTEGSGAKKIREAEWERELRRQRRKAEEEKNRAIEEEVRQERKGLHEFSLLQIAVIFVSAVFLLGFSCLYVIRLSEHHENVSMLNEQKTTLSALQRQNTLTENRIRESIDYAAVYDTAVSEYHMTVPEKRQIVYYQKTMSEYVERTGE